MARHQRSDVPATPRQRRAAELLGVAIGLGAVATVAGVVGFGINVAPSVQADELRQPPKVSRPVTPVAGPGRIFDDLPPGFPAFSGVPYDGGKNGEGAAVEVSRIATSSRVPTSTPATRVPAGAERAPVPSRTEPAPADPLHDDGQFGDGCEQPGTPERCDPKPPKDDPLTDDGEFGDGCETPGTPERCDPIVGLPPVTVEEPAEEETPVDEVEVVETVEFQTNAKEAS